MTSHWLGYGNVHPGNLYGKYLAETPVIRENGTSLFLYSGSGKQELVVIFASLQPPFPVCCNYNESRDAMKINEPVGASLSNNLKSWNNEISTKSRYTIQIQEQTKPKQNKETVFEEPKTQTA